jgi:hypothetical protein
MRELQSATQPCSAEVALLLQVCSVVRHPVMHCGSGWVGTEVAQVATHVCLALRQALAAVFKAARQGWRHVRNAVRALWQAADL